MRQTLKEAFDAYPHDYLSIGISGDGQSWRCISIPWENTASAMNMKTPDIMLMPEELKDEEVWQRLGNYHVNGCYIFEPLEDYSFLARLPELWDIYIEKGSAITDLSFMSGLNQWFMFYLEDAVLEDLKPLFPENWKAKGLHSYCLGLGNCKVKDISAVERREIYLSELVIIQPEGTNEKSRWKNVRAGRYSYFEYKERL